MKGPSNDQLEIVARVRSAWDAAADHFDAEPGHKLGEATKRAWQRLLGPIFDRLGDRDALQIVEVGTGTGEMAIVLAELGCHVTAVDISPMMLARAGAKVRGRDLDVHFIEAPAHAIALPDGRADVVFARDVLWALPDPHAGLREWQRLLRPGGMVAVADGWWNPPDRLSSARRKAGAVLRQIFEAHRRDYLAEALVDLSSPLSGGVSPYSIRYYLDTAGFERLRVRDLAAIRAAARQDLPIWRWVDQPQYTWLATGFKPGHAG